MLIGQWEMYDSRTSPPDGTQAQMWFRVECVRSRKSLKGIWQQIRKLKEIINFNDINCKDALHWIYNCSYQKKKFYPTTCRVWGGVRLHRSPLILRLPMSALNVNCSQFGKLKRWYFLTILEILWMSLEDFGKLLLGVPGYKNCRCFLTFFLLEQNSFNISLSHF